MGGLVGAPAAPPTADPLQDGPPEKKQRKGRKPKALRDQEAVDALQKQRADIQVRAKVSAPFVEELISWPFDIVASKRGPFWTLQKPERERLAFCIAVVMEKWLPDFMLKYGEEIALGAVFAGVVIGRVREDRRVHPRVKRPRGDGSAEERQDNAAQEATHTAAE